MDHDELIRTRLSINERPLKRLTARFYKWSTSLSTGSVEDIENGLQSFLLEISQFQLGLSRTKLITEMAERERGHYEQDQQQIKENIAKSEEELKALVGMLKKAKQDRANKIEYDKLAAEVSKFPSRESSQETIANLKAEILELEQEAYQQSQVMELRKKQFFTALLCLQSIQESIEEDQREEAKRLFHKRTHHDDDDDEEEEEGGFVESMEDIAAISSTSALAVVNGLERAPSQDGRSAVARGNDSAMASPFMSAFHTPGPSSGVVGGADEGGVFLMSLQPSHSTDSMHQTPVGTPGRANHPSPTPPPRSLTGTPNPADISMIVDG
ncbi:THO complex subunit 7 [Modicella reniformis]|uniref:THO complex subunit 7 n=1 Tax=Modicella reniformis TaxID=1440133 RepID=A0A9P6MBG5_9FUNG|nr:THO complex subunit 7 [Modicella reniformis]